MSPQLAQPLPQIPQISNPPLPVLYNASASNQVVIEVPENNKHGVSEFRLRISHDVLLELDFVNTLSALRNNNSFINNDLISCILTKAS